MTRKQRRIALIGSALGVLALAVGLVLNAMRDFDRVLQFADRRGREAHQARRPHPPWRTGEGGQCRAPREYGGRFDVTDGKNTIAVAYQGLLPDLFREGQGVVTEGTLDSSGTFKADSVLAKHDEAYMPREVADALKKQGHWKEGADAAGRVRRRGGRNDRRTRSLRTGAGVGAGAGAVDRAALRRASR